jgi:hypothetical protein
MSKADKKQRHRAKREAKKREMRRREAVSPLKRLADAPGPIECWTSGEFKEMGQIQMFVYKRAAGLSGVASFLVDQGVVGLKDAWTRTRVERDEFHGMLEASRKRGIPMKLVAVEEIRRWVAGGMRWAHDNGMRLPKDWVKTVSLIGGVGDWESADVSAFVKEFAGHPEDLRQRLIREPFETYIQRTDVDFIFSDIAPYLDQDLDEYLDEDDLDEEEMEAIEEALPDEAIDAFTELCMPSAAGLAEETANWLAKRGNEPSTELIEAWRSLLFASLLSGASMPDGSPEEIANFSQLLMDRMSGGVEEFRRDQYLRAVSQALEHLQTDGSMMQKAVSKYGTALGPGEGLLE